MSVQELAETVRDFRPLAELVPAHWQTGSIVVDDGTTIHYTRTGGDKPAVLLLHGVQVDGLTWLRTAQALQGTYDVVMPDFRGHGQSGRVQQNGTSNEQMVQDTIALITALQLDNPFVVGHSMGADAAGRLAAAHPVRAAVLVDPALVNFTASMPQWDIDNPPPWMQGIFATMRTLQTLPHEERMTAGLQLLPPGPPVAWHEADYVSYVDAHARFDLDVYRFTPQLSYLFEDPDVIARINCPILLLTARPMMPNANIETGLSAFTLNWTGGQHIHFEDSGHAIMFEQFDRFIQVINNFFAAN